MAKLNFELQEQADLDGEFSVEIEVADLLRPGEVGVEVRYSVNPPGRCGFGRTEPAKLGWDGVIFRLRWAPYPAELGEVELAAWNGPSEFLREGSDGELTDPVAAGLPAELLPVWQAADRAAEQIRRQDEVACLRAKIAQAEEDLAALRRKLRALEGEPQS